MAWTNPPTFVAGDQLTASQLNQYLTANTTYLKGIADGVTASGVQLNHDTSPQSISNTTATNVSFQNEVFDYGGWWSAGTTITVPAGAIPAGYTTIMLIVVCRARWATNATGNRRIRPLKNGTLFGSHTIGGLTGDPTDQTITEFTLAAAGDTIQMEVYQSSGGALDLDVGNISVIRFAPAA